MHAKVVLPTETVNLRSFSVEARPVAQQPLHVRSAGRGKACEVRGSPTPKNPPPPVVCTAPGTFTQHYLRDQS